MNGDRRHYAPGVFLLSVVGVFAAAVIIVSEALGSPDRPVFWTLGGAALGLVFIIYGLILLLLRKMGMIGPRQAER